MEKIKIRKYAKLRWIAKNRNRLATNWILAITIGICSAGVMIANYDKPAVMPLLIIAVYSFYYAISNFKRLVRF